MRAGPLTTQDAAGWGGRYPQNSDLQPFQTCVSVLFLLGKRVLQLPTQSFDPISGSM